MLPLLLLVAGRVVVLLLQGEIYRGLNESSTTTRRNPSLGNNVTTSSAS